MDNDPVVEDSADPWAESDAAHPDESALDSLDQCLPTGGRGVAATWCLIGRADVYLEEARGEHEGR